MLGRLLPRVVATLVTVVTACGDDGGETLADVSPFAAEVADLVAAGDADGLIALAELQTVACVTNVEGAGGPPQCEEGDAEGTEYQVFPGAVCEGFWTRDPVSVLAAFAGAGDPFALAELGTPPPWADQVPYGEQVLVFSPPEGGRVIEAKALYLEGERIVRAQHGCRRADQFLEPGVDEETPTVAWQAEP